MVYENQLLQNRDELLYLELVHAMSSGDIGRMEATFLPWIYIFKATGKHKYTFHLMQMMLNLEDVYPAKLVSVLSSILREHELTMFIGTSYT